MGSINPLNGLFFSGFSRPIYPAHLLPSIMVKDLLLHSANMLTLHLRPWHLPNIHLTLLDHQGFIPVKLTLPSPCRIDTSSTSCQHPYQAQPASQAPLRFDLVMKLMASSSPLWLCFLWAQNNY